MKSSPRWKRVRTGPRTKGWTKGDCSPGPTSTADTPKNSPVTRCFVCPTPWISRWTVSDGWTSTESEYFSQRSAGSLTVSPGWLPVPCQEQGGGPNPTNGTFCCSGSFCRKRKCSHLWQSMCEEQQSTSGWPRNWGRGMQEAPVPWAEAWPGLCPFCLAKIRHTISHFTASFYRPDKVLPSECQDEKNPDAWPAGVSSLTDRMKASRAGCRTGWCTGSKPSHAGDQPGHNPRLDGCSAGRDSAVDRMGGHYTAILLLNQRAELTFKND